MVKAQVISLKIHSTPLGERVYAIFKTAGERTLAIWLPADREILDSLQLGKTIVLKQRPSGRLYWMPPLQLSYREDKRSHPPRSDPLNNCKTPSRNPSIT